MARARADDDDEEADDLAADDQESFDEDIPAEDDAEPADDDAGDAPLNIFETDDDAAEVGVSEDDYEDDEDEGRPFYRHPILLAAIGVVLLVGVALGWTWVAFDREAYDAALAPP